MRNENRPRENPRFGAMDVILIIVGIALLAFTVAMINIFKQQGAVPDTLITCFFATMGGECGVMGWIKTSKEKTKRESNRDGGEP